MDRKGPQEEDRLVAAILFVAAVVLGGSAGAVIAGEPMLVSLWWAFLVYGGLLALAQGVVMMTRKIQQMDPVVEIYKALYLVLYTSIMVVLAEAVWRFSNPEAAPWRWSPLSLLSSAASSTWRVLLEWVWPF